VAWRVQSVRLLRGARTRLKCRRCPARRAAQSARGSLATNSCHAPSGQHFKVPAGEAGRCQPPAGGREVPASGRGGQWAVTQLAASGEQGGPAKPTAPNPAQSLQPTATWQTADWDTGIADRGSPQADVYSSGGQIPSDIKGIHPPWVPQESDPPMAERCGRSIGATRSISAQQ